jgi:hypothetical protein
VVIRYLQFLPEGVAADGAHAVGFRTGDRGTHTSRTMMFRELAETFAAVPADAARADYAQAIIERNALGKATYATRKLTNQRLGEIYALDVTVPVFRLLRNVWEVDASSRPQMALLVALARDPLLRATAAPVVALTPGDAPAQADVAAALREATAGRLNDGIVDKVVRNALSSWTQSGHVQGRARKVRVALKPTPLATAFAIHLALSAGFAPALVLDSAWLTVLDLDRSSARQMARTAHQQGLLDYREAAGVVEIDTGRLLRLGGDGHGQN